MNQSTVTFSGKPLERLREAAAMAGYDDVEDVVRIGAALLVTFMECASQGYTEVLFRNPKTKRCRTVVVPVLAKASSKEKTDVDPMV